MPYHIPTEIILHIISFLIPNPPEFPYPNDHPVTRTLLSLTLVCKNTYHIANQLLIQHCLYLTSAEAIERLADAALISPALPQTQAIVHIKAPPLPPAEPGPCPTLWSLRDYNQHVNAFDSLFSLVGHCLKKLVLNSHFHAYSSWIHNDPFSPGHVRIRDAFCLLTPLEEFYCVQNDRNFSCTSTPAPPTWSYWPNLRRLALAHAELSQVFLQALDSLENLTHLFLFLPTVFDLHVPQIPCSGPRSLQRLIVVVSNAYPCMLATARRFYLDVECFLGRMFRYRMLPSPENGPGRISVLSLTAPVVMDHPFSNADNVRVEQWFFDQVQQGRLWDLRPSENLRMVFEV